jgi:hypothetical protein
MIAGDTTPVLGFEQGRRTREWWRGHAPQIEKTEPLSVTGLRLLS